MTDLAAENLRLRAELKETEGRVVEAEAALAAVRAGRIDAITPAGPTTPLLLEEAQRALVASERQLRAVFQSSQDVMAITDEAGRFVIVNSAGAELFGLPIETLLGRSLGDLCDVTAEDHARFWAVLLQTGRARAELAVTRGGGSRQRVEAVAIKSVLPRRNLIVLHDVTEERRAHEQVRQSAERYRSLFEGIPQPILVFDASTLEILTVNEAAVASYGYSREEFRGHTVTDIRPGEDIPGFLQALAAVSDETAHLGRWRHRHKDGTLLTAEVTTHEMEFGGRRARLAVLNDVTDRQRAEEARSRLAAIVTSSHDAIFSKSLDGTIETWNSGAERLYQYRAGETIGRSVRILAPEADSAEMTDILARTERGERIENLETVRRRKDGQTIDVALTVSPIRDAAGRVVGASVIARGIGERKKLEAQLRQAQKMEVIGRLAGGVAHDFNNLLTVIAGYSELLVTQLGEGHKSQRSVHEIQRAAERAAGLTRQLLTFSRKQVLQARVIDPNVLIADMEGMIRRLIGEDISFTTSVKGALGHVMADPGQLEQVLMNLIVNARDAMPRGGSLHLETADIELGESFLGDRPGMRAGRYVMIAVTDTGIGMDAVTQSHLFEPFFTTKEPGSGTGLGLATAYGIIQQSGGHIAVYSEVSHGTTFKVYLPRVDPAAGRGVSAPGTASGFRRGTETVLIVDDEDGLRSVARDILQALGYTVLDAASGAAALEQIRAHPAPIHLMVTDVVMPGMSGLELAAQVAQLRPETRVLFVSGYSEEAVVQHGIMAAGTSFLQKPFALGDLSRKVREVLESPPPEATSGA